jgi:hypothetical protein
MGCDLLVYEFLLVVLLGLGIILYGVWQRSRPAKNRTTRTPVTQLTKRSKEQKLFAGLTQKPLCVACERTPGQDEPPPAAPPPLIHSPCGRPRTVVTTHHFRPELTCRYYGWVGLGNIRANGHPKGSSSRQLQCVACRRYFLETHGTFLHGKHVPAELLVRVVAALAEGLGIRAVARGSEVDPNTVLAWLVEAADSL